jgi:hypothetical protein
MGVPAGQEIGSIPEAVELHIPGSAAKTKKEQKLRKTGTESIFSRRVLLRYCRRG